MSSFCSPCARTANWGNCRRIWYLPRILPAPSPLASLSPSFEAQLLVLRSLPNASSPTPKLLALFPFTTTTVTSSLVGQPLQLRCERDSPAAGQGHLVVAWGVDGELDSLIKRCVQIASNALATSIPPPPTTFGPHGLTWCTWNALGQDYTLSQVLSSLDAFAALPDPSFSESIDSVLLDDGWQDTELYLDPETKRAVEDTERDGKVLASFGVRKGWFDVECGLGMEDSGYGAVGESRGELGEAVRMIKERGVERVGVWMTLAG